MTGNRGEAIRILEELLAYYERSKVRVEFHLLNVAMAYRILSYTYYCEGSWKEVMETGKKGIEFMMKCSKGRALATFLNNYACAFCEIENPAVGKEYFELTAGLASFYLDKKLQKDAERNYEIALKMERTVK